MATASVNTDASGQQSTTQHFQQVAQPSIQQSTLQSVSGLENLPTEVHHEIMSYFIGPKSGTAYAGAAGGMTDPYADDLAFQTHHPFKDHPYNQLAGTSKVLKDVVEGYCKLLISRHSQMNIKLNRKSPNVFRKKWLKRVNGGCLFCGSATTRYSSFHRLISCCKACESLHWPNVNQTQAWYRYGVRRKELLHHSEAPKPYFLSRWSGCQHVYLESEIVAFAKAVRRDRILSKLQVRMQRLQKSLLMVGEEMAATRDAIAEAIADPDIPAN
ncbi:MAG: hypothetical protein M1817_005243 [Caeruleum heppii]|nr:MAG: hypothetical protein M1817_005243 [Caeruleum heppii]